MHVSKYDGLLWYAGVSESTTDFDKSRASKQCSKRRNDNFYETLDPSNALYYHQNCYLTYASNNHIDRYLKRKNQNQEVSCVKRSKRSSTTFFDFKKNYLICGETCNIEKDKKHPERSNTNKSFLCRTADRRKWIRISQFQSTY